MHKRGVPVRNLQVEKEETTLVGTTLGTSDACLPVTTVSVKWSGLDALRRVSP